MCYHQSKGPDKFSINSCQGKESQATYFQRLLLRFLHISIIIISTNAPTCRLFSKASLFAAWLLLFEDSSYASTKSTLTSLPLKLRHFCKQTKRHRRTPPSESPGHLEIRRAAGASPEEDPLQRPPHFEGGRVARTPG